MEKNSDLLEIWVKPDCEGKVKVKLITNKGHDTWEQEVRAWVRYQGKVWDLVAEGGEKSQPRKTETE